MLSGSLKKHLTNPMIGILPFAIHIILQEYVLPVQYALMLSLLITVGGEFALRKYFSPRIHGLTFYIVAIAFVVMAAVWIVGNSWIEKDYTYTLIGEVVIIAHLITFRIGRTFLKVRFFRHRSFMEKALLNDSFVTTAILKYLLIAHVLLILLYKQVFESFLYVRDLVDFILFILIPIVIIVGLFVYQIFRTRYLVKKLHQEEWIPIVTEKGEVKGRIAKAVSKNLKNKYLHPVVRVALVANNKIYLQDRDSDYILDAGKTDHPFEKYILFKHEIGEAAANSIKRRMGDDVDSCPEFVFKYVFENDITKRLVFLFVLKVEDENQIVRTAKMRGKFWTVKQIDESFEDGLFSECFELEYEYLKHVVLLDDADVLFAKAEELCQNNDCCFNDFD